MKKIICIILLSFFVCINAYSSSDGTNQMSKVDSNSEVKDCFEGLNRGIFAFNQALDTIIIEPVAAFDS